MKTFARFTAVIFMLLGVLIIVGGASFVFSGSIIQMPQSPVSGILPDMTGMFVLVRLAAGGVIALQGFFLIAVGEGLWLLAGIFEQTARTNNSLYALMMHNKQANK
jgi:hypothetical protein